MTEKSKFVAIVESENKIDSLLLQNTIGPLGKIISFEISDLSDTQPSVDFKKIQLVYLWEKLISSEGDISEFV